MMTDTFKSGQWRICATCLGTIKPRDRACYLYDEIACMDCLTADEEKAVEKLSELPYYFDDSEQSNDGGEEHGGTADLEGSEVPES
jgi:hypothetical protein